MFRFLKQAAAVLAAVGLAVPMTTLAQTQDDDDRRIETIVVTAEKREEDILDVPMIITAFNSQMIEELGLTRSDDLEQLVPGLQIGESHNRKGSGTVIRGMGNRAAGELQGNMAVATYVDGVYHTSQTAVLDGLFDVERVEVARGPRARCTVGTPSPARSRSTPSGRRTTGTSTPWWNTRTSSASATGSPAAVP